MKRDEDVIIVPPSLRDAIGIWLWTYVIDKLPPQAEAA